MAKRGFFAELQYQNQKAARRNQQAASAAARRNAAAQRQSQQAALRAARTATQLQKASVAEQKRRAVEAKQLHIEAMEAAVEARNASISESIEVIDSLLEVSLMVPIAVNLEELRATVEHPPFSAPELETPAPVPELIVAPPEPQFVEPPAPKGLGATFGGKKHYAEAVAAATKAFDEAHQKWQQESAKIPSIQLGQMQAHQRFEEERLAKLASLRQTYDEECRQRDDAVNQSNKELDALIAGLVKNDKEALQTYVSIVLESFPYPDDFPVSHDYSYDSDLKELKLTASIPGPSTLPTVREYKYNRTKDEVLETNFTQKQMKDRYAHALYSVALRSLHEIFEADQDGHIQTIALTIDTEDANPATGQMIRPPLLAVAVDRETFRGYDLTKVVPLATLQHMKALISKSPFEMLAIDQSRGVRNRGA